MASYEEIVRTLTIGLANQKRSLDELNIELEAVKKELGDFEGEYSKEVKTLNDRIDAINVQIDKTIKEAIAQLPKQITTDEINELISSQLISLETKEDEFKTFIADYLAKAISVVQSKVKDGKDGADGKDGKNGINGKDGKDGTDGQDGKDGERGEQGLRGEAGQDGEDGISLIDIYPNPLDKLEVTFELSDGSKKNIKLPTLEKVIKRTSKMSADGTTLIVKTNTSIDLEPNSQLVLADCTNSAIQIKLPEPFICINSNRSYRIGIQKIDKSSNVVTVVSFNGELILNELSQELVYNEVLNLVTDGTNWYYAN